MRNIFEAKNNLDWIIRCVSIIVLISQSGILCSCARTAVVDHPGKMQHHDELLQKQGSDSCGNICINAQIAKAEYLLSMIDQGRIDRYTSAGLTSMVLDDIGAELGRLKKNVINHGYKPMFDDHGLPAVASDQYKVNIIYSIEEAESVLNGMHPRLKSNYDAKNVLETLIKTLKDI